MSSNSRASVFRKMVAQGPKLEEIYSGFNANTTPCEQNFIKANSKFFAIALEGIGGPVAVIKHIRPGQLKSNPPTLSGHSAEVLDFEFNPFDEHMLVTASDDTTIKVWGIPENGVKQTILHPLTTLHGHALRVKLVRFHPAAAGVLASVGSDLTMKLWDVERSLESLNMEQHPTSITDLVFSYDGASIATGCKDKAVRLWDPRAQNVTATIENAHAGDSSIKLAWMHNYDKIVSVGSDSSAGRSVKRVFKIWDPRNVGAGALTSVELDKGRGGVVMPFYDPDTSLMYFAGKGDANIRYYDMANQVGIGEYRSALTAQKGMAFVPKRGLDVMRCEVARALRLTSAGVVEPVKFVVPRKLTYEFQADLFPDSVSGVPALSAGQWLAGQTKGPNRASLRPVRTAPQMLADLDDAEAFILELELKIAATKKKTKILAAAADSFSGQMSEASKYRKLAADLPRPDAAFSGFPVSDLTPCEQNFIKANSKFFALPLGGSPVGTVAVVPHGQPGGRWLPGSPVIAGHVGEVMDVDWSPFDAHLLATGGDEALIKLWRIPEDGLAATNLSDALTELSGHGLRVKLLRFHPAASGVLASASSDLSVKIWDAEHSRCAVSIDEGHSSSIQDIVWNREGSTLLSSCADGAVRIWDPRAASVSATVAGAHSGSGGSIKLLWLSNFGKFLSVGCTDGRPPKRQYKLWDPRSLGECLHTVDLDHRTGTVMPFYDAETSLMFLAGKGDNNVRCYDMAKGVSVAEYRAIHSAQKGFAFLPRRSLDLAGGEMARGLRLTSSGTVEPIKFEISLKHYMFSRDLAPDCESDTPSLLAGEWLGGQNKLIDLSSARIRQTPEQILRAILAAERRIEDLEIILNGGKKIATSAPDRSVFSFYAGPTTDTSDIGSVLSAAATSSGGSISAAAEKIMSDELYGGAGRSSGPPILRPSIDDVWGGGGASSGMESSLMRESGAVSRAAAASVINQSINPAYAPRDVYLEETQL